VQRVAIAGSIAQRPGYGGHAWALVQYAIGLRSLGFEVLFIDRLTREMAPDSSTRARCTRWFQRVMGSIDNVSSTLIVDDRDPVGLSRRQLEQWLATCDLLLNFMGFLDDEDLLGRVGCRAYIDIDPGFPQIWCALGLHDGFEGHDVFVTVGENVGRPDCEVPTCGRKWITTRPPILLDAWPPAPQGAAFTSVCSWRGPYGPVDYEGRRFGLRVHEFRRFFDLPRRTRARFELALDIDEADNRDIDALRNHGWILVAPTRVAGEPTSYRDFIQHSLAELSVAKSMYVDTGGGWFSDRSVCYLASGKPVLAQDTGFSSNYPTGEGLLAFTNPDQAKAGVEAILAAPATHRQRARELAEEHFDARTVLRSLIDRIDGEFR
jgi:hypothetical protein